MSTYSPNPLRWSVISVPGWSATEPDWAKPQRWRVICRRTFPRIRAWA